MKTDTTPFNLEKALKGQPVVLRSGTKAYIRHHETELATSHPLMGYAVREGRGDITTWTEDGHFYADRNETKHDIVGMWTEHLVFEHWNLLNEDIKYLARDWDGNWYGYDGKPTIDFEGWYASRIYWEIPLKPSLFPECDWKESLIERPANE